MITGVNKVNSDKDYRKIFLDSSSSLKDFSMDRRKYFKKYLCNEEVEDEETQASTMGRIVETILLEPDLFDDRFHLSACANTPSGLMLAFVEALYKRTKEATDEDGNISLSFEDLSRGAYADSGFKIAYDTVIKKFEGSDAEIYYNEIRIVRSKGLTVVTANDVANGERIVEELKNNPVTKDIVNLVDSKRYTVLNQLQIEGFEVDGHMFKAMIDKCIIDHKEETIQIYDLKCIWSPEQFYEKYYLYRHAFLQAYLYFRAASKYLWNKELQVYEVLPPKFIVCDSINYYNPLIYTLTLEDLDDAYDGFEYKGRQYTGVKDLIIDLKWAMENNVWNISRKNSLSNGVVKLKG